MKAILATAVTAGTAIMMWAGYGSSAPAEAPRNCWSYRQPQETAPLPQPPGRVIRCELPEEPRNCWSYGDRPTAKLPQQPKQIHGVGICGCCCGIGGPDLKADTLTVDTFVNGKRAPLQVDLVAVRAEHPTHASGWKRVCAPCQAPRATPKYCEVPKPLPPGTVK